MACRIFTAVCGIFCCGKPAELSHGKWDQTRTPMEACSLNHRNAGDVPGCPLNVTTFKISHKEERKILPHQALLHMRTDLRSGGMMICQFSQAKVCLKYRDLDCPFLFCLCGLWDLISLTRDSISTLSSKSSKS